MLTIKVLDAMGVGYSNRSEGTFDYFQSGHKTIFDEYIFYSYRTDWVNDYGITEYTALAWKTQNLSEVSFWNAAGKKVFHMTGPRADLTLDPDSGWTSHGDRVPSGTFDPNTDVDFTGNKYADDMYLSSSGDTIIARGKAGNDFLHIESAQTAKIYGGIGNDTLSSYADYNAADNATIEGGGGNDSIKFYNASGTAKIHGGAGNDIITFAYTGKDSQAYGGKGADSFIFQSQNSIWERISILDYNKFSDTLIIETDESRKDFDLDITRDSAGTTIDVDHAFEIFVAGRSLYMKDIDIFFV